MLDKCCMLCYTENEGINRKENSVYQKTHKARQDHLCTGCGNIIEKGTQYQQIGLIPKNKDYHVDCLPKDEPAPVTETTVEPEVKDDPIWTIGNHRTETTATINKQIEEMRDTNIQEPETKPNLTQTRDVKGKFARSKREKDLSTRIMLGLANKGK